MTEYLTEQEQIELLKNWIKQYSLVIIAGVLIAILAITGWRYWQQHQLKMLSHASVIYDEMLTMRAQNNTNSTLQQATKLYERYPKTSYGQIAAFMLAREAMSKKNYVAAEKYLQWVIDQGKTNIFRQIARIRLARLLITEHHPEAAINTLNTINENHFTAMIDEVKGDAYLSLGDKNKAKEAYQHALTELPNAEVIRPLLQMKYDNLVTPESFVS